MALFNIFIFSNLFNIWFNKRQLDSHVCFYIQSVDIDFG